MDKRVSKDVSFSVPGYNNVKEYSQAVLQSVVAGIKASNSLPAAGDTYDYYNSFTGFRKFVQKEGRKIVELMTSILKAQGMKHTFRGLTDEEMFELLVDANDAMLEKVANCLDEASGKKKKEELIVATFTPRTVSTSWNRRKNDSARSLPAEYRLLTAKNIQRPQLNFKDKIDNSNSCFVPVITYKPNLLKPLAILLEKIGDEEEFSHPYEFENDHFKPLEKHLYPNKEQIPKPLNETPLVHVNTVEDLKALLEDLKMVCEFAVDLEHHSYRTFQGFTCLIQISTRQKDYIIDALELRSELHILNEVFTDPKICKVIHGADMDVVWLQRDFGVYIVNLFDTGQAARILSFAHFSLAHLLNHYCKIEPNKKYQLADWRIRPIPEEMIRYAREDTHYLLHVCDRMKADLIKKANGKTNLVSSVFLHSKLICLKKYKKPIFQDTSYLSLYKKSKKTFNARQLFALKQIYQWRDNIARMEDESIGYVLPNHMLLQIAEILPREQQGILACCNPLPPLVRQQLNELHKIILKARELSLTKQVEVPEVSTDISHLESRIDLDSILHCPHDLKEEEDSNLPTVMGGDFDSLDDPTSSINNISCFKMKPAVTVFEECPEMPKAKCIKLAETFVSPYQRYTLTKLLSVHGVDEKTLTSAATKRMENVHNVDKVPTKKNEEVSDKVDNENDINKRKSEWPEGQVNTHTQKRKKKKPCPDVPLKDNSIPLPAEKPKKKGIKDFVKTFPNPFRPFDYSQEKHTIFSESDKKEKKKKKKHFDPDTNTDSNASHSKTQKKLRRRDKTIPLKKEKSRNKWPKN